MTKERVKFLIQFDEYVTNNVTNKNYLNYWLEHGISNDCDLFGLECIAEDDELWLDVVNAFAYVIKYGETAE